MTEKNVKLVMIGASGHGKVCAEIAKLSGYEEIVFLDDDTSISACGEYPVVGTSNDYPRFLDCKTDFFVSIGQSKYRIKLQNLLENAGAVIPTLIHPNATVSTSATIGKGTVIMAGSVINSDATVGKGCIINTCSSVDHDCIVGDWCHVAVGAHVCGTVNIGSNTWVGAGSIISNNLEICEDCMIGAGAVVVNKIVEKGTYIGIPARKVIF